MPYRRAYHPPSIGKADLLTVLRANEELSRGAGWRAGRAYVAPTQRHLVERQLHALSCGRRDFATNAGPREIFAIADYVGLTPAIASALREQVTFLEQPGISWAARFAEALLPGTDTTGLASIYAMRLSATFDRSKVSLGARNHLAGLVAEARDDNIDALPDLMALAAVEATRAARVSGRGPYLRAYLDAGELLLDLFSFAAPRRSRTARVFKEMAHV